MYGTLPEFGRLALQLIPPEVGAELGDGLAALGLGLAVGLAGLGSGIAERGIGAAAVGALAEDSMSLAIALVMTVIPETLVLLALVVAFI